MGDIADRTPNANKFDILRAVGADSRVGQKCILPGYGFGGPCFPRDNRALGLYAKSVGINPMLMTATDEYNFYHADRMAEKLLEEDKEEVSSFFFSLFFGFPPHGGVVLCRALPCVRSTCSRTLRTSPSALCRSWRSRSLWRWRAAW